MIANRSQSYNTAPIRDFINRYFNDTHLDSFCQDYFFEEVYNHFVRGMSKNQKINQLLDGCRRQPQGFEKLLDALQNRFQNNEEILRELAQVRSESAQAQSSHTRVREVPVAPSVKLFQKVEQMSHQEAPTGTSTVATGGPNDVSLDSTPSDPIVKETAKPPSGWSDKNKFFLVDSTN